MEFKVYIVALVLMCSVVSITHAASFNIPLEHEIEETGEQILNIILKCVFFKLIDFFIE